MNLKDFFSRCYCVNLSRRPDRWESVQKNVVPAWPLAAIERWPAIDGQIVPHPNWWKAGKGAWGVYRSHTAIIERCLNDGVKSVLILEDDAFLCDGFVPRVEQFLAAVPADWDMVYLGGQHLFSGRHPPRPVNDMVCQAFNVNRCHAWAVSAKGMPLVYKHLNPREWHKNHRRNKPREGQQHHIDHHLGWLHEWGYRGGGVKVYTPSIELDWLIGQAPGKSNINGVDHELRFWSQKEWISRRDQRQHATVVAVTGVFHEGINRIADLVKSLGIPVEEEGLNEVCRNACPDIVDPLANSTQSQIEALRKWCDQHSNEQPTIVAKHPRLSLMLPAMKGAWPGMKLIVVETPSDEATAWLEQKGRFDGPANAGEIQQQLVAKREADLAAIGGDIPTLRIAYDDPQAVARLAAFMDGNMPIITPTDLSQAPLPRVIVVVGPSRCGSSCMAGVLQELGVPMGDDNWRPNWKNPMGFFEDKGLMDIWRDAYPKDGHFVSRLEPENGTVRLRAWAQRRFNEGPMIGGKQEVLCYLIPEMAAAWPDLRVVIPERPAEEIARSMHRAGFNKALSLDDTIAKVQRQIDIRDAAIASCGIRSLRVSFDALTRDPATAVDRLIAFCGLTPTTEQRAAAIAFIRPELKHIGVA